MNKWKFMPLLFAGIAALVIGVFMLLWNNLIPQIIGFSAITFWQAAGLLILSKMLFGGSRFSNRNVFKSRHYHAHWKQRFKSKWEQMPEDDKQNWEMGFARVINHGNSFNRGER